MFRLADTLPPEHLNVGVARVRLGHTLALERRYQDAEGESLAGYEILTKPPSAPERWLQNARTDLVQDYEALHQADKANKFRVELTQPAKKQHPLVSAK